MASARKRGEKFMALYRDADGKQKSAGTYATKKAAVSAATLAEAGMVPVKTVDVYSDRKRGKLTVAGYAPGWLANHPMAPHTAYVYDQMLRCHILSALGGRVLADVTAADIRAMFPALEAKGTSQALGKKIKTVAAVAERGAVVGSDYDSKPLQRQGGLYDPADYLCGPVPARIYAQNKPADQLGASPLLRFMQGR